MNKFKSFLKSPKFVFGMVWILTIFLFVFGWSRYAMNFRNRAHELQKSAAVSLLTADGLKQKLAQSNAAVSVVHLWATWCEPCTRELPIYNEIQKRFSPQNVEFYLISADAPTDEKEVLSFLQSKEIHFTTYLIEGEQPAFIKTLHPTWAGALPATFIFRAGGKLDSMTLGETTNEQLQAKIQSALAAK